MNNEVEGVKGHGNKYLVIVLTGLVILIMVLIIGLVFVNMQKRDDSSIASIGSEFEEDNADKQSIEDEDRIIAESEAARAEAEALLEREPVDIERINELYDSVLKLALELGREDYVTVLVYERNDLLLSKGLKKEALATLINGDYSMLSGPDLYRTYAKIIELADELGDTEVAKKYRDLQATVAGEYWSDYYATEGSVREKRIRAMMEGDEEIVESSDDEEVIE